MIDNVKLPGTASTIAVMNWVDANPQESLCHTLFQFENGTSLIVSDNESSILWELVEMGLRAPYKLPNGWERIFDDKLVCWSCRKGDRKIFITE
jgi:hypothetical protein